MPKTSITENMFYLKDNFYYYKEPKNEKQEKRKHFRKKCPACECFFITSKPASITCSNECRSKQSQSKNTQVFIDGHYSKGESRQKVELFTKKGYRYHIDNEDLDSVKRIGWTNDKDGYITTRIIMSGGVGINIKLHRFILKAKQGEIVDHIDGDVSNNTKSNLRLVCKSINGLNRNREKCRSNTGEMGVTIIDGLYVARVSQKINGKRKIYRFSSKVLSEAAEWAENKRQEIINAKL